jgi:hypothetical protein
MVEGWTWARAASCFNVTGILIDNRLTPA